MRIEKKIRITPKKKKSEINLKKFVKEKIFRITYDNVGYDDIIMPLVILVVVIAAISGVGAIISAIAQQVGWPSVLTFFVWLIIIIGSLIGGIRSLHWWLNS